LDEAGVVVGREAHHDVPAHGLGPASEAGRGERHAETVGEWVDQDDVAAEDGRLHGARGDVVEIGERGLRSGAEEKRQREGAEPFAPEAARESVLSSSR